MPSLGGAPYLIGADVETVICQGIANISVGMFPSGTDTMKVEATLEDPREADATWFDIIATSNDGSVVSLAGPIGGIRATRVAGTEVDNKLVVQFPSN